MQGMQEKHNEAHLVVGSDRVDEFKTLLNKYNGKEYHFDKIHVHSAGQRDPDAEGTEGMSASKMREAASNGHIDTFKSGLPSKLSEKDKEETYHKVRKGMAINEDEGGDAPAATDADPTNNTGSMMWAPALLANLRVLYLHLKRLKRRKQFAAFRDVV
jgi:hypothetical protein